MGRHKRCKGQADDFASCMRLSSPHPTQMGPKHGDGAKTQVCGVLFAQWEDAATKGRPHLLRNEHLRCCSVSVAVGASWQRLCEDIHAPPASAAGRR